MFQDTKKYNMSTRIKIRKIFDDYKVVTAQENVVRIATQEDLDKYPPNESDLPLSLVEGDIGVYG